MMSFKTNIEITIPAWLSSSEADALENMLKAYFRDALDIRAFSIVINPEVKP